MVYHTNLLLSFHILIHYLLLSIECLPFTFHRPLVEVLLDSQSVLTESKLILKLLVQCPVISQTYVQYTVVQSVKKASFFTMNSSFLEITDYMRLFSLKKGYNIVHHTCDLIN